MTKFKYEIVKNNLSWESKRAAYSCDHDLCTELGKYKAPKSRLQLNEYYLFCLKHVTAYNKSWDFYKGMSVDQIENSMRNDTVWDRPSWPLKNNYRGTFDEFNNYVDDFIKTQDDKFNDNYFKNKLLDEKLTIEDTKALNDLDLEMPISLEKIKKNYKKLVKIFHPDVNGNNKKAEEKFKEINKSYRTLLSKFKNEQKK